MRIKHLNTLRLIALLTIIVYHFYPKLVPGGFVGVDVLFCLSGYLLTSIVIDKIDKKKDPSVKDFFKKRFYRIYPSLFFMVFLVLFLGSFGKTDYLTDISRQAAAALGSVTNWYEIATGGSYEAKFIRHYFVHTWYLSIAIHEYLLFGLAVGLIFFSFRDKEMMAGLKGIRFRKSMARFSLVIILIELGMTLWGYFSKTSYAWIYFSDLTRFYPFFAGCFAATYGGLKAIPPSFQSKARKTSRGKARFIAFSCLFLILFLAFQVSYESWRTYLVGLPLVSFLTALLLIYIRLLYEKDLQKREDELFAPENENNAVLSGELLMSDCSSPSHETAAFSQPGSLNEKTERALSPYRDRLDRRVQTLSEYSYCLYLFHWPLFVFFTQFLSDSLSVLLALVCSTLLAAFSTRIFEPLVRGEEPENKSAWAGALFQKRRPLLILFMILLLAGGYRGLMKAPYMTSLEQQLWAGQMGQDMDQLEALGQEVLSQKKISQAKGCYIIGDSVLLSPRRYLIENIPNAQVNAAASRTPQQAFALLQAKVQKGDLPDVVVLCIGTNSITKEDFKYIEKSIEILPPGKRMVLVTPYNAKANDNWKSSAINRYELSIQNQYDYVTVVDWHKVASEDPSLYDKTDGVHFGGKKKTYEKYAQCINAGIKEAMSKPAKGKE